MKGPLNVIRRRRSERPANETDAAQAATEAPTEAHPAADAGPVAPAPAASQAPPTPELPAGQEPAPAKPSFRERGRLRRRLRYLRRVRELGFRDLGGLVFDQHKFSRVNEELVRGKLHALAGVDGELRALEHALDDRRSITELREPGISVCPRCGALHGSEARFCPSCGVPFRGPRAIGEVGEAVSLSVGEIGAVTPPAASTPATAVQGEPRAGGASPLWVEQLAEGERQAAEPQAADGEPRAGEHEAAEGEPRAGEHEAAEGEPRAGEHEAAAGEQHGAEGEQLAAAGEQHATYGDQPTQAMLPVDEDAANGGPGTVAQPTGERHEP